MRMRLIKTWIASLVLGLGLTLGGTAQALDLDPAMQALVAAGDVDGVAAALTARIGGNANEASALMQAIAQFDPDIALSR